MSAKRSLRSLSNEVPDAEAVDRILLSLSKRADREAAIVGAALVESALQNRLVNAFVHAPEKLRERIFEDRGPLSDFNSKILIAQAMSVVGERLADDMQRIRKIRNCFAHARMEVLFTDPLIAKEVFDLAVVIAANKAYQGDDIVAQAYKLPKTAFSLCCYVTYAMLNNSQVDEHST